MLQNRNKILMILAMIALVVWSALPASAYEIRQEWARISATAGETLTRGNLVCIKSSDGYAYKADADDSTLRPAVGVVNKGGASGAKVEIVTIGVFSGWTSLTPGGAAYLSATAGAVTQTKPDFAQIVGFADSATDYFFNFTSNFRPNTGAVALTAGAAVTLTVGQSTLYTLTPNDNEDTTITFSGAGSAGDEITLVIATGSGTVGDEIITFHATLVSSVGTLTAANTASRYYVVRFISSGTHWYEVSRTAIQT